MQRSKSTWHATSDKCFYMYSLLAKARPCSMGHGATSERHKLSTVGMGTARVC
jgi:hypothetical protein